MNQSAGRMSIAGQGNLAEAILWFVVALAIVVVAIRRPSSKGRDLLVLSAAFAVFGVSDLIEIRTGAWWRPTWLLAMKGACVVVFVLCFWRYLKSRKSTPPAE